MSTDCENRLFTNTDWEGYLKYLDAVGNGRTRVTYDRGALELFSPSQEQERIKSALASLIECLLIETAIDFEYGGSMTFKNRQLDRGLEPDECYWITNWKAVHNRTYQPLVDPPPDLVVEVDITSSSIDRMALYRSLRVPEIWRYCRDESLRVFLLKEPEGYRESAHSLSFPDFPVQEISRFLAMRKNLSATGVVLEFRRWLGEKSGRRDSAA